jgi:hypothetical protein
MKYEDLQNDVPLFEKILLAYWYSIPYDNHFGPDQIKYVRDNGRFININLIKDNREYGGGCITKTEINNYITKLNHIRKHEKDITERFNKEESDGKCNN